MENDDQDIIDAEHLIQDDTCSEGEDEELDAKISVEHEKFRQQLVGLAVHIVGIVAAFASEKHFCAQLAAQTKQLRARSAPAIGSPSSAKQRKRSAERLQASQLHVETNSPREVQI